MRLVVVLLGEELPDLIRARGRRGGRRLGGLDNDGQVQDFFALIGEGAGLAEESLWRSMLDRYICR